MYTTSWGEQQLTPPQQEFLEQYQVNNDCYHFIDEKGELADSSALHNNQR